MGTGGGPVSFVLASGTARFDGKELVVDFKMDVEVSMGPEQMTGEIVYHFEGQRQ